MTTINLKHVDRFRDRHGKTHYYFRRSRGHRRVTLPGLPGSEEFMAAYRAALAATGDTPPARPAKVRGTPGTFDRLTFDYFQSTAFLDLKPSTQHAYRRVIEAFAVEHGHRSVADMRREDVDKIMAQKAATPAAANDVLKKLRILIGFAIDRRLRSDDPTLRIKRFKAGEFHTWTEDEIAQFEKYWPPGTRERTAFALHLYTGQRRSDVHRMLWPDIAGGAIKVTQTKTGASLTLALHPKLKAVLDAWPRAHVAILTTNYGKPFTAAGYGMWLSHAIREAGLPARCVTHGLRKAAARRLAEAGCSASEIAAVTGHTSLKEVERYTRAADQKRLASAAIARLKK